MRKITRKKLYKELSNYNVNIEYLKTLKLKKSVLSKMVILYSDLEFLLNNGVHVKTDEERKKLVKMVENIEYDLQECWGFNKDVSFHSYWYRIKGCTCPKIDNADRFGTEVRVYNAGCKFHGEVTDYIDIKLNEAIELMKQGKVLKTKIDTYYLYSNHTMLVKSGDSVVPARTDGPLDYIPRVKVFNSLEEAESEVT
jgi:hypothetical protein